MEDEAAAANAASRQYDWRPRPDPTVLTTAQLRETEAAVLRTLAERIAGLRELIEQRLDGMDQATILLAERIGKIDPELAQGRTALRAETASAIVNLRELLESRIDAIDRATRLLAATQDKIPSEVDKAVSGLRELLGARIDGMDVATKVLADSVAKFPTDIDRAVTSAKDLIQSQLRNVQDTSLEKFSAIDGTFASNALALTAALAAQKEAAAEQNKSNTLAITKSEQATKETIGANAAQTTAGLASQAATISDLKERVVRIESMGVGAAGQRTERRLDYGTLIAAVAILVSLATVLVVAFKP
jgi:hypothetical protein